jgi:hypothetical protein
MSNTLFVLDGGGARVRSFDVAEIAFRLNGGGVPEIAAKPLIDGLPFRGEAVDLTVGPGGVIHVADPASGTLYTFARRP